MNFCKKMSRYKTYINIAQITLFALTSIATTAISSSIALISMSSSYSVPAVFATATVCGSLSKKLMLK